MTLVIEKQTLTPPEAAKQLGVSDEKILHWIHTGELAAVNLVKDINDKARFKIRVTALEDFLKLRAVIPPHAKKKRRRRASEVKQFM